MCKLLSKQQRSGRLPAALTTCRLSDEARVAPWLAATDFHHQHDTHRSLLHAHHAQVAHVGAAPPFKSMLPSAAGGT
jgi:hypothetical protein